MKKHNSKYMRQNGFVPVLILIVIAILGVIGYFAYNNILERSLLWKTAKGSKVAFQITYPSTWHNCAETHPDLYNSLEISSDLSTCGVNIFGDSSSSFINVGNTEETSTRTDVKDYLKDAEDEFNKLQRESSPPGMPILPIAPGFTWNFENYENNLLCIKDASVAKVRGIGAPTYIILYKNKIYQLQFSPTNGLSSVPLRIMLCSLRLP